MFEKGQYIHYGSQGVCMVDDIVTGLDGFPADKTFYILIPAEHTDSVIYTPVNNEKVVMRKLMTEGEITQLIQEIEAIAPFEIEEDREREHKYKEALLSGDCKQWFQVIKTAYIRQTERIAQGRKITTTDDRYYRAAEEKLCEEISFVLGKEKGDIQEKLRGIMDALIE